MKIKSYAINPRQFVELYHQGNHDELSRRFLLLLDQLNGDSFNELTPEISRFLNEFVRLFLYLFIKDDYHISEAYRTRFVYRSPVISNCVLLTQSKTTDRQLEILAKQNNSLVKILTLLSPRNNVVFKVSAFFDENPCLASLWYSTYYLSVASMVTERVFRNLNLHQEAADRRWAINGTINEICGPASPYFFSTYVNPETDRHIKQHINRCIKQLFSNVTIINEPNRKRIAILSARWNKESAVYRSCARFVAALHPHYDLTLIHLAAPGGDFDRTIFSDIRIMSTDSLETVMKNDFMVAYFPDIGMHDEDRFLSNLRFAPIQVMGYGHPVSSWGGEIDYFIGGRNVEIAGLAGKHYSERLVLMPGIGAIPNHPVAVPKGISSPDDRIIINCPWSSHKCNFPHFTTLRAILESSHKNVQFRFFTGVGPESQNGFLCLKRDIQEMLGKDNVRVYPFMSPVEYMNVMEEGHFSIDSWPFGGYNTIVDSLWLGKPVVSLEGDMFINRASSALLRQVGLEELVAGSREEYIEKSLRLIHDDEWRALLQDKIRSIDLEGTLFDPGYADNFKKTIDYLIDNHDRLKKEGSRNPIIIE